MPSLSKELRNRLANRTLVARESVEKGVRAALENLAVHEPAPRSHMSAEQRALRNRLRAHGRALGDVREISGAQSMNHLVGEASYEHWHRLLFTRFLTENNLLRTDAANGYVPVTLADCDELAPELGARNGFELACRFASQILPGVFRSDDPVLELRLAPNDEVTLKDILDELPSEVFTADDSLGWTYQFWQAKRKDEVNSSGKKIGADEISPVTQLFTEDYMVSFLLDNTLGAWWAGKQGPIHAANEADARRNVALPERDGMPAVEWNYLRFVQDEESKAWLPAAGTFAGWPKAAMAITMLDPCMGSGHFLVFALPIIARLRMQEESLNAQQAVVAVLRDNIHGLELDARCTQIAAFNVALTAWKLAGFQQLPAPHISCSGIAPQAKLADWMRLAGTDERLQEGMKRLYELFEQAPILGSLIDPKQSWDLMGSGYDELQPLLEKAMVDDKADDAAHEMAVTAKGIATAAQLLAGRFALTMTNVPYLGRGKQDDALQEYSGSVFPASKSDLATCFVERSIDFCEVNGTAILVTPQNWLFLGSYRKLREGLLQSVKWDFVSRLGPKGFQTPMWDFNIMLIGLTRAKAREAHRFASLDVASETTPIAKANSLQHNTVSLLSQEAQLRNPDSRVLQREGSGTVNLLSAKAQAYQGIITGDRNSFIYRFWEVQKLTEEWEVFVDGFSGEGLPLGRENIILWEKEGGRLFHLAEVNRDRLHDMHESGKLSWGRKGVLLTRIGLRATPYYGERYDNNLICVTPTHEKDAAALYSFCRSDDYRDAVRELDQKLSLTNATACKVAVNLDEWSSSGEFPAPVSSDPTQWLFNGHPKDSEQPLHVAVARLMGYRWPRQTGSSFPDCPALEPDGLERFADKDGILCLPPINQEQPAAARLRQLLGDALGTFDERSLIAAAGGKADTLEVWLRDEFFEHHSKLFHHRPFVWHIWDGRKDGFHALVNYHHLDHAALQKLAYSYLGDWIRLQEEGVKADKPGAAERLGAAQDLQQELAKILDGEAPYDIFIRWKPLHEQVSGWHPDMNDGVGVNIRPFMRATDVGKKGAGILRWKPNIKWDKDRGTEPKRDKSDYPWFWCEEDPGTDPKGGATFTGNRWNDVHLSLKRKHEAKG